MGVDEECNCGYVKSEVFWGHLSGDGGQAISGCVSKVQGAGEVGDGNMGVVLRDGMPSLVSPCNHLSSR